MYAVERAGMREAGGERAGGERGRPFRKGAAAAVQRWPRAGVGPRWSVEGLLHKV